MLFSPIHSAVAFVPSTTSNGSNQFLGILNTARHCFVNVNVRKVFENLDRFERDSSLL